MSSDLISALASLTAPDREVDALIMGACFEWAKPEPPYLAPHCVGDQPIYWHAPEPYYKRPAPELTASLDAVVALCERVLPGWYWSVDQRGIAVVCEKHGEGAVWCNDVETTPAIALLIAILTALETSDGTE